MLSEDLKAKGNCFQGKGNDTRWPPESPGKNKEHRKW